MIKFGLIGLGEAGSIFANDLAEMGCEVYGFDPNLKRFLHQNVHFCENNKNVVQQADVILSVNLSAAAEEIAQEVLPFLNKNQFYLEMNTAAPKQKKAIAAILQPSGVSFIDAAIMAPVPPKGIFTSLLLCGDNIAFFLEKIKPLALNISTLKAPIGAAATKKLLRSIVYKGVAAVICEAMEVAETMNETAYMRQQIKSIIGDDDLLIDRFIEGSKIHAERRMYEMEAVVEMLKDADIQPFMSEATKNNLKKNAKKNSIFPISRR
jgi:3-hydroxyisobutyrate dehydrogenase-like beta-hydroxyacid dehydrogenase